MRRLPLVDRLRVRTPCDVGWESMEDRGRDRHCARCDLTVHDVSAMTRADVETLLEARERGERVCLHLHVRKTDGAVLVADGHVEHARIAPPSRLVAAAMATATALSACASAAPPAQAVIAVAPVETAPAPPIEPEPTPAPEPARIEPPVTTTPAPPVKQPAPAKPAKKIASPPPKKAPPSKKHYDVLDGDAW